MRIYFLIKISKKKKKNNYFYLGFVRTGFFIEIIFICVDGTSVDWRCFIEGLLLSLGKVIEHREANGFSSTELNDDCWSSFGLDDFKLLDVVSLLNRKRKDKYSYYQFNLVRNKDMLW